MSLFVIMLDCIIGNLTKCYLNGYNVAQFKNYNMFKTVSRQKNFCDEPKNACMRGDILAPNELKQH